MRHAQEDGHARQRSADASSSTTQRHPGSVPAAHVNIQPAEGDKDQFIPLCLLTALLLCCVSGVTTAAVCVYPSRVADAVKTLKAANSSLPVASGKPPET